MISLEENYKKVEDVVLNGNFNLTKESAKKFHDILWNQQHAPEYALVAKQPDKRLFVDWEASDCHDLYTSFLDALHDDDGSFGDISYEEFHSNKLNDGTKLMKHLKECLLERKNINKLAKIYDGFYPNKVCQEMMRQFFPNKLEKYNDSIEFRSKPTFNPETGKIEMHIKSGEHSLVFREEISEERYAKKVKNTMDYVIASLNTKFISVKDKKNIKLCFSLNFADWMLASTKNNWTSCLSLESGYGYWKGLAGLVGDMNRMMVFTTNMEEKEFMGIKSYDMIERMWLFTLERTGTTFIHGNLMYPRKTNFDVSSLKKFIPEWKDVRFDDQMDTEAHSKYAFPMIYQIEDDSVISASIYEDTLAKVPLDMDRCIYVQGDGLNHSVYNYRKDDIEARLKNLAVDSYEDITSDSDALYLSERYEHK